MSVPVIVVINLTGLSAAASNSQHLTGEAADISAGNPVENKKLFDMIVKSSIPYDQLIDESKYQWIHISYSKVKNRKQVLHLCDFMQYFTVCSAGF